jgi:hypothetical protein
LIWKKLYPLCPSETVTEVINLYTKYWNNSLSSIEFGNSIPTANDNITYWKCVKSNIPGSAYFAGDFAIRMTCAGVTQCGVERAFSYLKWLFGLKRHSLGKETICNLLRLKNAEI